MCGHGIHQCKTVMCQTCMNEEGYEKRSCPRVAIAHTKKKTHPTPQRRHPFEMHCLSVKPGVGVFAKLQVKVHATRQASTNDLVIVTGLGK